MEQEKNEQLGLSVKEMFQDKKRGFMLKGAIVIAILCTIVVAACGLIWGTVIEGSLFAEVAKWAVVNLGIIAILETFWYTLGQVSYHWKEDYKKKYGKGWFWKGLKEDIQYLWSQMTWKKVGKVLLYYVIFFGLAGLLIWVLP
jgi:hypothetical protein